MLSFYLQALCVVFIQEKHFIFFTTHMHNEECAVTRCLSDVHHTLVSKRLSNVKQFEILQIHP